MERIGSGEAETRDTREAAEARARELADALAGAGDEVKILVHDARGKIVGEEEQH